MTNRIHGLLVVLDTDLREDDAESLVTALRQLRGVCAVQPLVVDPGTHAARTRARIELTQKLWDVLKDDLGTL